MILDTEDYRYRREQSLTRMAMRVARDVQRSGRSQLLEPMNPFERSWCIPLSAEWTT